MRVALIVTLAAATLATGAAPSLAQGVGTQFLIAEVQRQTPDCKAHPDFPVVGRVSGIISGIPARGVSFVGCFPSMASCERWRGPVSGKISGRITQNRCTPR